MISYGLWLYFSYKKTNRYDYSYNWSGVKSSDSDIAITLLMTILLTPFAIIVDLVLLPFELLYLICLKIVKKEACRDVSKIPDGSDE